ncbi:hypothetical protein ABIE19_000922 [Brevundimonas faecalis]|jgi:hypothetical protein|uniref:Uncharacterized protein n=1 Tax=Brevundimonas faecalis TaxID=947378 RepID=A0ABV2R9L7_9CAUL
MPAEAVPFVAALASAFLVLMGVLGFVSVWSNMGEGRK